MLGTVILISHFIPLCMFLSTRIQAHLVGTWPTFKNYYYYYYYYVSLYLHVPACACMCLEHALTAWPVFITWVLSRHAEDAVPWKEAP